jgi:hypothetical protein
MKFAATASLSVRFRPIADITKLWIIPLMTMFISLLVSASAVESGDPFGPGRTAAIFSTVEQSEFCPPGEVRVNLRDGTYLLTPRSTRDVCNDPNLERPITGGNLAVQQLAELRAAYVAVQRSGTVHPSCVAGQPDEIVVDNGGPHILIVTNGMASTPAPDDLGCWSKEARALHGLLDRMFSKGR